MFSGIIEAIGVVKSLKTDKGNLHIEVNSPFLNELKIDQSVAHNGVCLTVVEILENSYVVTAIEETLNKTNLGALQVGQEVNLERCMQLNARLDGHIVQGHVDQIATCIDVKELDGSWEYTFKYDASLGNITIEKGSITINGVSLTVIDSKRDAFSVAIIPYTYKHTNFNSLNIGSIVNLEFDVIGKYISKLQKMQA